MKFVANASFGTGASLATKGCVALLLAALVGLAPHVALAGPDTSANDAEVEVLVQSVFEAEYPKKQYVEALEKLQLASTVCQEGSCGAKMRLHSECILLLARDSITPRHFLGRLAHHLAC